MNKRNISISMALSVVTGGVYGIYWYYLLIKNIKAMRGKNDSCTGELLCLIFVPFYSLYWWYTRGAFVRKKLQLYGYTCRGNEWKYFILALFGLGLFALARMQQDFNALPSTIDWNDMREDVVLRCDFAKIKNSNIVVEKNIMKRKTIIAVVFIVLLSAILVLPSAIYSYKRSYVWNLLSEDIKREAFDYAQELYPSSEGSLKVYKISTSDDESNQCKQIIRKNFFKRTDFEYPYAKTMVYLENESIQLVVYFEKDSSGFNRIVDCREIR